MPSAALAELESLLSARKLDHTLASRLPQAKAYGPASTGLAALDELLAGGLPRGQISEIVGPRSSGRQTLLVSWLAAATARGELAALVDPLDMFDPPSAAAHGLDLSRLLWVRGRAPGPDRVSLPREAGELGVEVDRALKALNLILQAGGFGLVALDLGEVPPPVVGRLPFTTWRRLHRVIEDSDTVSVVAAAGPLARSVAGITLTLEPQPADGSRLPAAVPRHLRLLPSLDIAGRAVCGRGMRSAAIQLSALRPEPYDSFSPAAEALPSPQ